MNKEDTTSQVLATFERFGSVQMELKVRNVCPEQLLYLGAYITLQAEQMLKAAESLKREQLVEQPKIAVPTLAEVRPSRRGAIRSGLIRGTKGG